MPSTYSCPYLTLDSSLLRSTQVLQKPYQGNFRKFQGSSESRFGGSKKDRHLLKIPKWQHKLFRNYKRGNLVSYFLINAAKTSLHRLKISKNIEFSLKHFFDSVAISTKVVPVPLTSKYAPL